MVADRISLINIYDVLLSIDEIEGKIDTILLNRNNGFGTKTIPRFNSLDDFKIFIDELYPYSVPKKCNCLTKNEGIYNLLSFSVKKKNDVIFINNLSDSFKSAKSDNINSKHFNLLNLLKTNTDNLTKLNEKYVCFPYMEYGYTDCDYIEMITNKQYNILIELYKKTK